jgi:tRNA G37 N-methylase TrmD
MGSGLVIRFDVVTLFPEMFAALTGSGITSRALDPLNARSSRSRTRRFCMACSD